MKKRALSTLLALCLCLGLLPGTALAAGRYTEEDAAARGLDLSFSTEVLDFGTAEYREGADLFPQTLSISVTNNGSEELRYWGWSISSGFPVEAVSAEGLVTRSVYEEVFSIPPGAWVTHAVDAKWLMPGATATFTFKCTLNRVRALEDGRISLMLDFPDSASDISEHDIYHPIAVFAEVTSPGYGMDLVVDKDSLEFVWSASGQTPATQTVTVTHTGVTDLVYVVDVSLRINGSILGFTLTGGHEEGGHSYPDRTYLSPGERCTITITPVAQQYLHAKNEEGALYIDGEVSPSASNPGNKEDEELTVDLTARLLVEGGYRISAVGSGKGTLTPSRTYENTDVLVPFGGSQTFTATPDPGYMVAAVYVDHVNIGRVSSYTFTDVEDTHSLKVIFEAEDRPYWYAPMTQGIWSNYPYTDVSTQTVNGKEQSAYTYPVGTVFYANSEMLAKAESPEDSLTPAREMNLHPGVLYELRLANGDTRTIGVILQGDPPASTDPADQLSSWAADQVEQAIAAGLVPAALQGKYTQTATRAEFCALATALYETVTGAPITQRTTFSDTSDENVEKMAALGVVNGVGNGKFNPTGPLTREQAATMLSRLAEVLGHPLASGTASFGDSAAIASWAAAAVGQVQAAGIMEGTGGGNFTPQGSYTREQSILTILRLYQKVG